MWVPVVETMGFSREVPYTTRARRSGEIDGRDHHYVSVTKFHEMIQTESLTDWDFVLGHYYGTGTSLIRRVSANEDIVLQVLGRMALRLKRRFPKVCMIMLKTSEQATLENRLRDRGYSGEQLQQRFHHGMEEWTHSPLFDFLVEDADIMTELECRRTFQDIIQSQRE